MSEEDVRKAVEPLILEYFENSDTMEVLFTLQVDAAKTCLDFQPPVSYDLTQRMAYFWDGVLNL